MKLKFLFVPVSILISIILAIWYIWPTWFRPEGVKDYQKRIALKQCELSEANLKVQNVEKLKRFLESPEGKSEAEKIYDYFLSDEKKENIINNINYAGSSSAVSVVNIAITDAEISSGNNSGKSTLLIDSTSKNKKVAAVSSATQLCINDVTEKYGEITDVNVDYLDPFTAVEATDSIIIPENNDQDLNKMIKAEISVIGSYKQLVVFLDNLYRMKMINNISFVDITKEIREGETEGSGEYLSMNVGVYFGYLPANNSAVSSFDDPIFEKSTFDIKAIEKLSKVIDAPDISIGETGKDNPFLP
ncbi:MAG: hypothetical protein M0P97_02490 [Candidatus Moranbacteria bacterium]|jgi:hypothetical protein|nr:hypothetical protein [Candidatus Moranbacteria bacterium]